MSQSRTLFVADAFTDQPFAGNPAAVCVLDQSADEQWMKRVAHEMNLAESAFLHPIEGGYSLRWLTPAVEVKLCGHATLASAFVLWETGRLAMDEEARFFTLSGWLTCRRKDGWIEMDFPANPAKETQVAGLADALGTALLWTGFSGMDYLAEVASETVLRSLVPNLNLIAGLGARGVIVTALSASPSYDFVSRFFAPAAGVNEDPVTGSAHCTLGPYWQAKLGKADFDAFQASERGGHVKVSVRGDRVLLRGQGVMMSKVELYH